MKTLQQQATEMLETIDTVEGEKKYARLTPSDRALIFRLAAKGNITQAEIAKAVGCEAMGERAEPITFHTVRAIGLKLQGVEDGTPYGSPALKVNGHMFACIAINIACPVARRVGAGG